MRRITVVLLMVFVLAAILGAAAPASAKDRRDRRDRISEWNYRRPGGPVHRWAYATYRGPSHPYPYMGYGTSYGNRPGYGYGSSYAYAPNYGYGYGQYGYGGYGQNTSYRYRHPRSIYVPRSVFVAYPDYVTVVQPVVYEDVVLVPQYRYRVIERYPDRFLLIFGTGALTVILRG